MKVVFGIGIAAIQNNVYHYDDIEVHAFIDRSQFVTEFLKKPNFKDLHQ